MRLKLLILLLCVIQVFCADDLINRDYTFSAALESRVSLSWSIEADKIFVRLRVLTTGWVGFGFSPEGRMMHSDAYVGFYNDGVQSVTDYYLAAAKIGCPGACPDTLQGGFANVLSSNVTEVDGVTTMYFSRFLDTNDTECDSIVSAVKYAVYAFSPNGDDTLTYHSQSNRGRLEINFYTGHVRVLKDNRDVLVVHGVVMFAIWNVITPLSVMLARYFTPKALAMKLHIYMQETVVIFSLGMTFLAIGFSYSHFQTTHAILGIIFLILCSIQGYLGNSIIFVFPFWKKKDGWRVPRPIRRISSKIHPWLGRILFVMSFACVWTGMYLFADFSWFHAIFWAWTGGIGLFYIVLEVMKQFLKRLRNAKRLHTNKIAQEGAPEKKEAFGSPKEIPLGDLAKVQPPPLSLSDSLAQPDGAEPQKTRRLATSTSTIGLGESAHITSGGNAKDAFAPSSPKRPESPLRTPPDSPGGSPAGLAGKVKRATRRLLWSSDSSDGLKTSVSSLLNASQSSLVHQFESPQMDGASPRKSSGRRKSLSTPEITGLILSKTTKWLVYGFFFIAVGILASGAAGIVYEGIDIYGTLPNFPDSPDGSLRRYYIAAEEYIWDYTPLGYDNMTGDPFTSSEALYTTPGQSLGNKYKKARYVQYTDATFTKKKEYAANSTFNDENLGLFGPVFRVMVGDTLQITFFNNASVPYSMHPHGVFYTKANEGASYNDGSPSAGDSVAPGQTYVYIWPVPPSAGPGPGDGSSVFFLYHSHVDESSDINAGLFGGIIVADPLRANNRTRVPTDVDKEFVLFFTDIDENSSPYLAQNVEMIDPDIDQSNANFTEGNRKMTINGYLYGNLPDLQMVQGQRIRWYVGTLGSNMDVHTPYWASHTVVDGTARAASTRLLAGSTNTLDMIATVPGTWNLICHATDHIAKGMAAQFTVLPKAGYHIGNSTGVERVYYIAADEVVWNYAPSPINLITGQPYTSTQIPFVQVGPGRIGPEYVKARYVEYTDETFTTQKPVPAEMQHLGMLGPIIRAEVGDNITIYFKNNARFPFNLILDNFVGLNDATNKRELVQPNSMEIFKWFAGPNTGPTAKQVNSILWTYSSISGEKYDIYSGLIGPVIITKTNQTNSTTGLPIGVDREFVLLFTVMDEGLSPYLDLNVATMASDPSSVTPSSMSGSNKKDSINGFIFGNLQLTMNMHENVRWYTFNEGLQSDYHTPFWYGHTVVQHELRTDQTPLFAGLTLTSDMVPDVNGTFIMDCHMVEHMNAGMQALYTVVATNDTLEVPPVTGKTRWYYIAADEVEWNYAPLGYNAITGQNFSSPIELSYTMSSPDMVGSKYIKAVYREYTDSTFTVLVNRSEEWEHMGLMGPAIRAVVGDKLLVKFKNNARFNFSMTPVGVVSLPSDNNAGAVVAPGQSFTYKWYVPERAGPTAEETSSIMWFYRSTVNEQKDVHTGLFGPIVISRKEGVNDTVPDGVDREFFLTLTAIDESASQYYQINLDTYLPPGAVPVNSFKMFAMNGYIYGNIPGLAMQLNQTVRWYSFVLGGAGDIHTVHWHGQTLLLQGRRLDVQTIQPTSLTVLDMVPTSLGEWLLHCHVNSHLDAGMSALFTVTEPPMPAGGEGGGGSTNGGAGGGYYGY